MSMIGVFANDPGGHTGLAWGIFNSKHEEGVQGALRDRQLAGSTTITGTPREQILQVAELWIAFYNECHDSACLDPDKVWHVCENYVQKPGSTVGGDETSISTSIIWGVEGYRMGRVAEFNKSRPKAKTLMPQVILQMAGEAKGYAGSQFLKDSGVWIVGREHERSAWQHVALFLKRHSIQMR